MSDPIARSLGLWRSWGLVVGCVIGSAIFMTPALLAPYATLGPISWGAAGAGAETLYWGFSLLLAGIPVYVLVTRGQGNS